MIQYSEAQEKKRFLHHFARHGGFSEAAAYAGRSSSCIRRWLSENDKFRAEAEDARKEYIERIEIT